MGQQHGWLADEMRRTAHVMDSPNGRALVEEAASRAEHDNRLEVAALHEGDIAVARDAWPAIVGADFAHHSRPVEMARGALVVVTCSHAWSQHLGFMCERIVAGVNEAIGRPEVDRVRLRVGPLLGPLHIPRPQLEMPKPGMRPRFVGLDSKSKRKYIGMNDREVVQRQYERVKQEVDSWPASIREIPGAQDLKIAMRQRDMVAPAIRGPKLQGGL